MKTIAIISAKGGVGKTTISVALADHLARNGKHVTIIDADVNAPNVAAWLGIKEWDETHDVKIFPLPNKYKRCDNPIVICNGEEIPITLEKRGTVNIKNDYQPPHADYTIDVISGDIAKGKTGSGKVVESVINKQPRTKDEQSVTILDTAPGTGYPVLTAISKADHAILITEASPLGLQDLQKLLSIVREKQKEHSIITNYADTNTAITQEIQNIAGKNYLGSIIFNNNIRRALEQKMIPRQDDLDNICKEAARRINA
ncbi:P-loop NTPase [Candidatus Woesearchaeota archaeon]|nr:P-loop NTPase [Candidatus Woesearchaeota archaeon]